MLECFSLQNKTILITGASSGIGKAVAQQCAMAGAICILTARNIGRLREVMVSLNGNGHRAIPADLTDIHEMESLVSELPKLDGVVCSAGIVETTLLKFSEDEELLRIFDTNTLSAIRLVRTLVQNKKLKKESSIVLVSSISGVKCGYIGGSLYGATKGALEGFVKGTALELASQRIRVNSIVPGMVNTSLLKESAIDEEQLRLDMQRYPLKRYGEPEEIAYAAVYLLSDATKWRTGSSLLIDGGYTLN